MGKQGSLLVSEWGKGYLQFGGGLPVQACLQLEHRDSCRHLLPQSLATGTTSTHMVIEPHQFGWFQLTLLVSFNHLFGNVV